MGREGATQEVRETATVGRKTHESKGSKVQRQEVAKQEHTLQLGQAEFSYHALFPLQNALSCSGGGCSGGGCSRWWCGRTALATAGSSGETRSDGDGGGWHVESEEELNGTVSVERGW